MTKLELKLCVFFCKLRPINCQILFCKIVILSSFSDMKRSANEEPSKKLDTLEEFHKPLLTTVHHAVANSATLPRDEDYTLYMTYPGVKNFLRSRSARTIELINTILSKGPSKRKTINPPGVTNLTKGTANDFLDRLVEINDDYQQYSTANLENSRSCHFGQVNKHASSVLEHLQANILEKGTANSENSVLTLTKEKVQEHFEDTIDNTEAVFVPKIFEKPNGITELPQNLINLQGERFPDRMGTIMLDRENDYQKKLSLTEEIYTHPYKQELIAFDTINWVHNNQSKWMNFDKNLENLVYNEEFTFVETVSGLHEFIKDCQKFDTIAVDTEYHNQRSYQGFICLIQASTSKHDYLIDALKLRSHLYLLNEVFTDPKIEKIFHGGETDSKWLQQCGVYLVNYFDTQMAKLVLHGAQTVEGGNESGLNIQKMGYKALCDEYLDVQISKKYQRSDWRKRPLLEDQLKYAREDTRRLIVLASVIKTEMSSAELIKSYDFCKEINLRRYEKPEFNEHSYQKIVQKVGYRLNEAQEECVRLLAAWRDQYARQEDENPNWVLPKYLLLNIARELPKESSGVLACCTPVPQAVREQIYDITDLVDKARLIQMKLDSEKTAGKIIHVARDLSSMAKVNIAKIAEEKGVFDYDDPMHCPHDRRRNTKYGKIKNVDAIVQVKEKADMFELEKVEPQKVTNLVSDNSESVTSHAFLVNIGKSIEKLQNFGGSFEWKFSDIEYKKPETAAKTEEALKPATTGNVEIDISSKIMSKKLKKIRKREEFQDMAVNAATTTLGKTDRNTGRWITVNRFIFFIK